MAISEKESGIKIYVFKTAFGTLLEMTEQKED